jgi:hypothetical protein
MPVGGDFAGQTAEDIAAMAAAEIAAGVIDPAEYVLSTFSLFSLSLLPTFSSLTLISAVPGSWNVCADGNTFLVMN